jgi:hypothetical protein
MHLFGRRLTIMITSSDSPFPGSGIPNQYLGVLLHTMAIFGLSRVRTKLSKLLIIPFLAPHPVQANGQPAGHGYLGGLSPAPHHEVEIFAAPGRLRTVTCAASASKKRNIELPCFVICPRRRKFPKSAASGAG